VRLEDWLTLEDVLAAARALASAPDRDLCVAARVVVARAAVARGWRRTHREAHPRFGSGSLAEAVSVPTAVGASTPQFLRAAAALCVALAETQGPVEPH
jgi:hypothetical protein